MVDGSIVRVYQHGAAKKTPSRGGMGKSPGRLEHENSYGSGCLGPSASFDTEPGPKQRGAMSNALRKRLGFTIISDKPENGSRIYKISLLGNL